MNLHAVAFRCAAGERLLGNAQMQAAHRFTVQWLRVLSVHTSFTPKALSPIPFLSMDAL